jgi:hypothetical protein
MADNQCDLLPGDIANAVAEQIPQLQMENALYSAKTNPYASLYRGGTVKNFQGDTIRSIVMNRVSTGQSLVNPVTTQANLACGTFGPQAQAGQTIFDSIVQDYRGESWLVCINKARETVIDAYEQATAGLKESLRDVLMAAQRWNLYYNAGLRYKVKVNGGTGNLTGGEDVVQAPWAPGLPNAPFTYKGLLYLVEQLQYNYDARITQFGTGEEQHFIGIFGIQQVNKFRDEEGVITDFRAAVTGGYTKEKNILWQYAFQPLYRGVRVGVDPDPLRFASVNGSGAPIFVEPYITSTDVDAGTAKLVRNPAWVNAPYEIGFLVAKDTFAWKVPEKLTRIGEMTWPAQNTTGELEWVDDDRVTAGNCNKYREFGQFIYRNVYAVTPIVPHGVITIAYQRCNQDLGFATCSFSSGSGTSSPVV